MITTAPTVKFGIRISDLKSGTYYSYAPPGQAPQTFYVDYTNAPQDTVDISRDGKTATIHCFTGSGEGATLRTGIQEDGHLLNVQG